jgi:hypothetical protein
MTVSTLGTGAALTQTNSTGRKEASGPPSSPIWVRNRPQSSRKCTIAGPTSTTTCPPAPSVGKAPAGRGQEAAAAVPTGRGSEETSGRTGRAAGQEAACGIADPRLSLLSRGRKIRMGIASGGGLAGNIGARFLTTVFRLVSGGSAKWLLNLRRERFPRPGPGPGFPVGSSAPALRLKARKRGTLT